jgi:hypothetical protein
MSKTMNRDHMTLKPYFPAQSVVRTGPGGQGK